MWKIFKVVAVVGFFFAVLMVAGSVRTFNWVHGLVRNYLGDFFGTDPAVSWLAALGVFALVCLIRWRSLVFAPVTGRPKPLITLAVASFAGAGALKVMNARFPFNQQGQPTQCWIESVEGRVILDLPPGSVDRKTGLACQALTPEILRSISLEKKRTEKAGASDNKYFSPNDGKPIAWFERDSCRMHTADGYDDLGQKLEPATKAKVESCEKARAEAERRSKAKAERDGRQAQLAEQAARQKTFRDIGRYIAQGRFVVIDGIKVVYEESVVLKSQTNVKFRIANIRDEQKTYPESKLEFGLLTGDGRQTRPSVVRRVEGSVAIAVDGSFVLPGPGERGWIVAEFPRECETGTGFALMINNAVAFTKPGEHTVRFQRF